MAQVICELVAVTYDIGPSLSPFVAKVSKIIRNQERVRHLLTPMGTVLEGEWQDVMDLVNEIFTTLEPEYQRMGFTLKVDYHKGRKDRIEGKVRSVEEKIDK